KKLSVEDYGVFGLFQSTIIILTFVLGFDFYTYSSREILKKNAQQFNFYFINQLAFHLLAYILIIPFSYFIFKLGFIEFKFVLILISEHLSQEFYRLLIVLNKTIVATTILFLRSGIWIIALYFFWNQKAVEASLNSLFLFWSVGAVLSVLLGFKYLKINKIKS